MFLLFESKQYEGESESCTWRHPTIHGAVNSWPPSGTTPAANRGQQLLFTWQGRVNRPSGVEMRRTSGWVILKRTHAEKDTFSVLDFPTLCSLGDKVLMQQQQNVHNKTKTKNQDWKTQKSAEHSWTFSHGGVFDSDNRLFSPWNSLLHLTKKKHHEVIKTPFFLPGWKMLEAEK